MTISNHIEIDDGRLNIAIQAAEQAGVSAESVKQTTTKEIKDNNTIVTEADKEAEHIVRNILTDNSSLPILGEEHGGNISSEDSYWVVDPIDGTTNFSYQQPIYGSAVALIEDNKPVIGAIYIPEMDYIFYAVEGKGAYRNQERLSVTDASINDRLYTSLSGKGTQTFYQGLSESSYWIQELHSAVASECWVASGWADIGIFGALAPWDMAAGTIILQESGGIIMDIKTGSEKWSDINNGKVIFGNKQLVKNFRNQLSESTINKILDTEYEV